MGPNLFLVAAPRSGSTQLARWLDSHPDIALSPVKEPNHFSADGFDPARVAACHLNDVDPETYARGRLRRRAQFAVFRERADYDALFAGMTAPWRMEASTSYLACPQAPARIAAQAPAARLILLTRAPLDRALSHYRLARRTGRTRMSLGQALAAEQAGQVPLAERFLLHPSVEQGPGIARFAAQFPAEQCLPLAFETMIDAPRLTLARIARWLDIDPGGFDLRIEARNAGIAPRLPALNTALEATGIKPRLRRALPPRWKAALKPLWFDAGRDIPIPQADRAALADALDAALARASEGATQCRPVS